MKCEELTLSSCPMLSKISLTTVGFTLCSIVSASVYVYRLGDRVTAVAEITTKELNAYEQKRDETFKRYDDRISSMQQDIRTACSKVDSIYNLILQTHSSSNKL